MTSFAGTYALTKYEQVTFSTGNAQDLTSTLSNCELSAIYKLNNDSTAIYTEPGTCTGSGTGNWIGSNSGISISFASGNGIKVNNTILISWNCKDLVLMTTYPNTVYNNRYTLSRLQR